MRVPVYCECNLTPVWQASEAYKSGDTSRPQYQQQRDVYPELRRMGFSQAFMVYDGTLNRAMTWADDNSIPIPGITNASSSPRWKTHQGEFSNPPGEGAVKACARLATMAGMYGADAPNYLPVCFDLENASTHIPLDSVPAQESAIERIRQVLIWTRQVNPLSHLWWYSLPPCPVSSALNSKNRLQSLYDLDSSRMWPIANLLSAACPSFYVWDIPAQNPDWWFRNVDEVQRKLDQHYNGLPRIAFLSPHYHTQDKTLNSKTIPIDLWRRMVRYLADRDWGMFLWVSPCVPSEHLSRMFGDVAKWKA